MHLSAVFCFSTLDELRIGATALLRLLLEKVLADVLVKGINVWTNLPNKSLSRLTSSSADLFEDIFVKPAMSANRIETSVIRFIVKGRNFRTSGTDFSRVSAEITDWCAEPRQPKSQP